MIKLGYKYLNFYYIYSDLNFIKMERKIKILHVGSMITLKALQRYLDNEKIDNMIKDVFSSNINVGIGKSYSSDELYVFEKDFEKAKQVLELFLSEN